MGDDHQTPLRELIETLMSTLDKLAPYDVCGLPDFAELLFERALSGTREKRGKKGTDLFAPDFGHVQVKCRRLPLDGRNEVRLHCRNLAFDGFDYLAAAVFNTDFTIKAATLIARMDVWPTIETCTDKEKKISFWTIARLSGAVDMTAKVQAVLKTL